MPGGAGAAHGSIRGLDEARAPEFGPLAPGMPAAHKGELSRARGWGNYHIEAQSEFPAENKPSRGMYIGDKLQIAVLHYFRHYSAGNCVYLDF